MTSCVEMKTLLSGSIDRELDAAGERALAEHLVTCEGCRTERRMLEAMSRELREAGRRVPSPPSWESIARSLSVRGRPRRTWFPARLRLAVAAAAALILLWIVGRAGLDATGRVVPAGVASAGLSSELISQLVDPHRQPDFSLLGRARAVARGQLHEVRNHVPFTPLTPETLPDGFRFESGWVITSDVCRMVCLRYRRNGRVLAVLQSASGGSAICDLSNPQCCLIAGLACRRFRIDRVDVVETTRRGLALTLAAPAGETDIEALLSSLVRDHPIGRN